MRAFTWASAALPLLVSACGDRPADAPAGRFFVTELTVDAVGFETEPYVLVVDDAQTTEAAKLRARLAVVLRTMLSQELAYRTQARGYDPAQESPLERTVTILWPSQIGAARFVGPSTFAGLHTNESFRTPKEAGELADAIAVALASPPTPVTTFAPIDAVRDLFDLTSVPPNVSIVVASTRDDMSPPAADDDAIHGFDIASVLLDPSSECSGLATSPFPRLSDFLSNSFGSASSGIECQEVTENGPFGAAEWRSGECREDDYEIARDAFGTASCVAQVITEDPCLEERGWSEPPAGQAPPVPLPQGWRFCDLEQLGGAALTSCRTDLACAECGSGYCLTDVPAFADDCGPTPKFRFVGGALIHGNVVLTCDVVQE